MSVINTNVMSLNAQRNLSTNSADLGTTIQRLSSGLRINSAKDDAAGLAISERFTTQIRGMDQAARNANDGISLAQTAEGALGEIGNNLQRIRELAVQSRNATNSDDDRAALQKEVGQLMAEIDRVADTTNFNGTKLLNGEFTNQAFQVGANQGQTINVEEIADANIDSLGKWDSVATSAKMSGTAPTGGTAAAAGTGSMTAAALGTATNADGNSYDAFTIDVGGTSVSVAASTGADPATGKAAALAAIETAINAANIPGLTIDSTTTPGTLAFSNAGTTAMSISGGALTATTAVTAGTAAGGFEAIGAAALTINNVDITVDSATNASERANQLVAAINAKTGGATGHGVTATLKDGALVLNSKTSDITIGGTAAAVGTGLTASATTAAGANGTTAYKAAENGKAGFADLNISTVDGADNAILAMDAALNAVNSSRADLGAIQNRFSSVVNNLQTNSENLSASRSRIVDADYAKETANLSRSQILAQAGTAMLAQANQVPQNVLSLLR